MSDEANELLHGSSITTRQRRCHEPAHPGIGGRERARMRINRRHVTLRLRQDSPVAALTSLATLACAHRKRCDSSTLAMIELPSGRMLDRSLPSHSTVSLGTGGGGLEVGLDPLGRHPVPLAAELALDLGTRNHAG